MNDLFSKKCLARNGKTFMGILCFLALVVTGIVNWILTANHGHPLDLFYFMIAVLSSSLIVLFLFAFIIEAVRQSRKEKDNL